jgi:hypothetical protein
LAVRQLITLPSALARRLTQVSVVTIFDWFLRLN